MTKVFIDGSQGTTGLKIFDRLKKRNDIELITLPNELRKDINARKDALCSADIAFLCLPDAASVEATELVADSDTVIIDTSTAHRTSDGWVYGFPELFDDGFEKIASAKRIASPGCYASGFIALVKPLIDNNIISPDQNFFCHAMSGYSGAGKKGIALYESDEKPPELFAPREYALTQEHKHLKEMQKISGLSVTPIFCPYICDFYSGMLVTVPIFKTQLNNGKTVEDIKSVYRSKYNSPIVKYKDSIDDGGFIASNSKSELDSMDISVAGNGDRILLTALYDNLGKGASGAALECMNIVMGLPPEYGLQL
ncbi:N-acetyl-gamma-glutamyl-phosphate reductase [uncultured Eubacterium sp.]|uniref:N-acetyl-gamma-glutamyl-phosphate reductase n=1 Tax=uncultured Eubacterium sp. TaxID=165185 RepID=UPI0025DF3423|nr:N-acetyl-gamma-glutamyl-phosphate reductase [uncultured Eubacterium sp.]